MKNYTIHLEYKSKRKNIKCCFEIDKYETFQIFIMYHVIEGTVPIEISPSFLDFNRYFIKTSDEKDYIHLKNYLETYAKEIKCSNT